MSRIDEILAEAEHLLPESHVAILAREVISLRQRIAQLEAQPSAAASPDLWVYHHSPLTYDVFEDRETAESVARSGLGELIPVWKAPQPSAAVVVPELTEADIEAIQSKHDGAWWLGEIVEEVAKEAYTLAVSRIRAIPADRALKDGQVAVDAKRLVALEAISDKIEALALGPDGRAWTPLHYREFARGELRNAQAGKDGAR